MGYGDGTLSSTKPPKKPKGAKKVIVRNSHRRGGTTIKTHTRRLKNGKVVVVKPFRRSGTDVVRHRKAGKGYGVRERRASGKIGYKRHGRGTEESKTKTS